MVALSKWSSCLLVLLEDIMQFIFTVYPPKPHLGSDCLRWKADKNDLDKQTNMNITLFVQARFIYTPSRLCRQGQEDLLHVLRDCSCTPSI
ncbi:hypothetical protein GQ457_09G003760 [Hibiscus cannabinus]